jgi:lipoprotein-releasing system permease protein
LNFPVFIAKRYLISKKSKNAINIISLISVLGVATGTAALIIILSVFNGFEDLLIKLNNTFAPDIKIESKLNKTFTLTNSQIDSLEISPYISSYSLCLEENAMLQFDERQFVATIKGVDDKYPKVVGIDSMIVIGEFVDYVYDVPVAIVGRGIYYYLQLNTEFSAPMNIFVPSRNKPIRGNFSDAADNINRLNVYVGGVFAISQEFDTKYVILPLKQVQDLLEYENSISSLEIKLNEKVKIKQAITGLKNIFGDEFSVKDRNMQHEYAYKIMRAEKWMITLILVMILLIASFNVIGSLTMLIIDKKQDIKILKSMGANNNLIRNIFFLEGVFISFCGVILGLFIGGLISWLQMTFGFVGLGGGSFIIDAYPVTFKYADLLLIFLIVMFIGVFAAWYPVRYITKRFVSVDY